MEEGITGFKDLRIVDNFYQTSSYFPMPTTEIGTLSLQYPLPSDWHNLVYSSFACAHKAIINKQFYACET